MDLTEEWMSNYTRRSHLPRLCIDPKSTVTGHPIIFVRDFLKYHQAHISKADAVEELFKAHYKANPAPDSYYYYRHKEEFDKLKALMELRASTFLELLVANGYLTSSSDEYGIEWKITDKGYSLGFSYACKPLSYVSAKKKIENLLKLVEDVRLSTKFLYKVKALYVFGHYAGQADQIGSIDVAVGLESKLRDKEKTAKIAQAIAKDAIREEKRYWRGPWRGTAEAVVGEYLKTAGSRHIRFFDLSSYVLSELKAVKIYEDTDAPSDDNALYEAIRDNNPFVEMDRPTYLKSKIAELGFLISSDRGFRFLDHTIYYSVGLYLHKGHPDILLLGTRPKEGNYILAHIGELIVKGRVFEPMKVYSDVLDGNKIVFREPSEESYHRKRMALAQEVYGDMNYPVYQAVFADKEGKFPWEEGCNESYAELQGFPKDEVDPKIIEMFHMRTSPAGQGEKL